MAGNNIIMEKAGKNTLLYIPHLYTFNNYNYFPGCSGEKIPDKAQYFYTSII